MELITLRPDKAVFAQQLIAFDQMVKKSNSGGGRDAVVSVRRSKGRYFDCVQIECFRAEREKQPFSIGPTSSQIPKCLCHIGLARFVFSGNGGQKRISRD